MLSPIYLATEGLDDEAVARKICSVLSISVAYSYPAGGKSKLDPKIKAHNKAAAISPWFVLRDLDGDAACPAGLLQELVTNPADQLLLRIPVRAIESWLLADAGSAASFLKIASTLVPRDPDALGNPKQELVNLARRSRSRSIRASMVPPEGFSVPIGPEYTARLIEYARLHWDPLRAAERSESLRRCLAALRRLYGL
jgi:hypothetical protein